MKITYIGDCYSVYLLQLAEEMKKYNYFDKINGFTFSKMTKSVETNFDEINHPFFTLENTYYPKIVGKVLMYMDLKMKIRTFCKSDIINIHFLYPIHRYLWSDIKSSCDKTVVTIWGSDFYRAKKDNLKKMETIISECDALTFGNELTAEDFKKFYNKLDLNDKIYIRRFGLRPLEFLQNNNISSKEAKKDLGLAKGKIIVMVGYSSNSGHQHEEIIRNLNKMNQELLKDIIVIFPMTYGDLSYRDKIEKKLRGSEFDYILLKDFMPYEDVAKLRLASDIMINVQISDQFSGSMQECLFAGSVVITGSWLPYDTFWENGIFALQIQKISELNGMLKYALNNLDNLKEKSKKNKDIIWELSSWKKNAPKWLDMYKDLMKKSKNPDGIN